MMDTWNPAQLNEKINMVGTGGSGSDLPDITPADYGSYLAVDENGKWGLDQPKTLPDYSTTEVATGQKWIDGKELYQKTIAYDLSDAGLPYGKVIETGVNDADFMFIDKHVFILPTGSVSGFFTGENVDGYDLILFITPEFKIKSSSSSNNFDAGAGRMLYVTIKYTKATPTRKTKK